MQIQIINPLNYPEWDELLLTNKNYSFFHSSHWARVLSESYQYEPVYFTVVDNGNLSLAIPVMEIKSPLTGTRGVSLPFTDICEPILPKNCEENEVWNALTEYGEKAGWKYLEIRGGNGFGRAQQPSSCYHEHILDLSQKLEDIHSHFRDSNKRNIKKAQNEQVEISVGDSLESVKQFYRLHCMTRKKHGLPPQPYSFFKLLYEYIISKNHGTLLLARYHGKTIAGALSLHFGEKATFKYGASNVRFQHLRPNNLILWKTIEFYSKRGITSFHFGRTDLAHMGLRHFKKGWGAEERVINYYRYNLLKKNFTNISSPVDGWHTSFFHKTPIPILKMIGSILYKHIG